jgi:predicted RNase H-like HicB family nuclease
MKSVDVIYHRESGRWWADSPAVPGWTATAESLQELRQLVEDGVRFALDSDEVLPIHRLEPGLPMPSGLFFDFAGGRTGVIGTGLPTVDIRDAGLQLAVTA